MFDSIHPCIDWLLFWVYSYSMMTSSNGNIFRVTGRGAMMFSLICAWINGWVKNRYAGDLRRHRAHYDVILTQLRARCMGYFVWMFFRGSLIFLPRYIIYASQAFPIKQYNYWTEILRLPALAVLEAPASQYEYCWAITLRLIIGISNSTLDQCRCSWILSDDQHTKQSNSRPIGITEYLEIFIAQEVLY